jgi:hypothetical protein
VKWIGNDLVLLTTDFEYWFCDKIQFRFTYVLEVEKRDFAKGKSISLSGKSIYLYYV